MKRCRLLLILVAVTIPFFGFDNFARVSTVEPDTAKVGDSATAKGENLDKTNVGELYLTNGKNDVKAKITSQSGTEIQFTVPKVEAGRYHLMILTANKASMIEQPVVLTVE
ncbi:MAG: IPT/TIG domain-containing protein [Bryobacteraceae bacterium]